MNPLDHARTPCGINDNYQLQRDYAQPLPKLPVITPQKPTMGSKLSKVADLFELDVINSEEALSACKTIIGQHTKVDTRSGANSTGDAKIVK